MKYIIRNGVLYRMIADEHFLISAGEAAKVCPAIQQINKGGIYYWKLLEQGKDSEEMLDIAAAESGVDKETLRPGLKHFLEGLEKKKYIIREETLQG